MCVRVRVRVRAGNDTNDICVLQVEVCVWCACVHVCVWISTCLAAVYCRPKYASGMRVCMRVNTYTDMVDISVLQAEVVLLYEI